MAEKDESVPDVLLPRRPPRQGEGRIGEARTSLFGDREAAGTANGGARWPAVEGRERSAALARAAIARPSPTEVEAPVEPGGAGGPDGAVTAGDSDGPHDTDPPGSDRAVGPAPDRRANDKDRARRLILLAMMLVIGVVLGLVIGRSSVAPAVTAPAPVPLSARATLIGEVVAVQDGETITVEVAGAPVDVVILGLDTPDPAAPGRAAQCGAGTALGYASDTLAGQAVTLVGDPSVGEFDDRGRRRAYVVLRNQASYTDLALGEGVGRRSADPPAWYDEVFVREEAAARTAGAGIWGAPCRAVL